MALGTMYPGIVNSPVTELAEAIDATQETILVIDASKLPAAPNLATLGTGENAETILYASKSGNYLESVTRGFQGSAANWAAGTQVARLFTAYDHDTARENIENLQQQLDEFEGMETHGNEYHDPAFATEAALAAHLADGTQHSKTARFVVGTSTAGWTLEDCAYLCDGTNDQEEIIQALNALPATGGEVVILDGTYNITASINIPKDNVSIRGNGNATTLKRMYNSTSADSGPTAGGLITLNEKSGCKIQGLQIDGNKATYTAVYNYGISLSSSSDNTVTGNTCNNNNRGIYLNSSSNNTVTGNICNNNNYDGICISSSSSNNAVTGNICNNNNRGIRLWSSSSNNTVTGNTCTNNNCGIYLSSSSNNTVTGNTCIRGTGQTSDYASDKYTILLFGTGNDYNLISSNNCMGKAVVVEGGTGNTVFNNKWDESSDFEDLKAEVIAHTAEKVSDGVHGMGSIASQEYEEGVWTPTLHFGGNNDGMTYASQQGKYVRTGNLVYFEMLIALTSKGSSVGNATIAGLPFAALGSPPRSFIISDVLNFPIRNNEYIMARLNAGSVMNLIYTSDMSNATPTITEADFSNNTRIILSGHYRI